MGVLRELFLATPSGKRFVDRIRSAAPQEAVVERDALREELKGLIAERDALKRELVERGALVARYGDTVPFVPNGHFYSPVHSKEELRKDLSRVFPPRIPSNIPGINLREPEQLELLKELGRLHAEMPFGLNDLDGRYTSDNPMFAPFDAMVLNGMLRHIKPKRVIEIGSGYSSAVTLDTNEGWLGGTAKCTFIEPYPETLYSRLKPRDRKQVEIIKSRAQDVDVQFFRQLQADDILFIDSTHVSKIGSDVNYLFFEVFPALADGVYIHIHDVFYPFEYIQEWVMGDGRAWNEMYVLRALLQDSTAYEIAFFNDFLWQKHRSAVDQAFASGLERRGGSIWLRKTNSAESA